MGDPRAHGSTAIMLYLQLVHKCGRGLLMSLSAGAWFPALAEFTLEMLLLLITTFVGGSPSPHGARFFTLVSPPNFQSSLMPLLGPCWAMEDALQCGLVSPVRSSPSSATALFA